MKKRKKNGKLLSIQSVLSLYHLLAAIVPVALAIVITLVFLATLIFMIYSNDVSGNSVFNNSRDVLTTYCCHYNIRSIENKIRRNPDDPLRFTLRHTYERLESYGLVVCVEDDDGVIYISEYTDRDYFYSNDFSDERECFVYLNDDITAIRDTVTLGENNNLTVTVMSPDKNYPLKKASILNNMQFSNYGFMMLVLAIVVFSVILDIIMVKALTKSILSSVTDLGNASRRIKSGNLEDPVKTSTPFSEIKELTDDFDEMRQQLKESHEIQKAEEKIRQDTYSGINHDSRTAITAIKGYTQGLIEDIANTPEKQAKYLKAIYGSALTLEKLMNAFSDVTTLENSDIQFNFKERNMYDIIEEWYEESKDMFEDRKILLNFTYNCDEHIYCNIDTFQFERVIENLLSNSKKYKKPENEFVHINIIARANDSLNMFELIYTDDGVGIRPDETERIFDRFYRSNEARSNVQDGSGVGLAIVKQIILRHSGTITASSTYGHGLQLIVHLPITKTEEVL